MPPKPYVLVLIELWDICYTLLNFSITSSKLLHWSFTSAIFATSRISKLFMRCRRLRRVLRSLPSQPIEECKRPSVHRPFLPSEYLDFMNLYLSLSCRMIRMTFSYLLVFISCNLYSETLI
jgi:hypothetical protein